MANILTALADEQDKNRKLTAIIEDQKPKVEFADYIAASENAIEMGDFSKLAQKTGSRSDGTICSRSCVNSEFLWATMFHISSI